ncbi:putative nuclease HARBI1 isoform X1 [Dreissena polymorpha]|uniref:putative nuclease HARBI1 isoform X1 n=1 Tax=Dreissena polymorpha TaxID=45954 RepID=UPI0022654FB4|nr:putative nuclease HARBI1 isoform X1 [Dreissena polymorpha]
MAEFYLYRNAGKNRQHSLNVDLNDEEMRSRYRFSNENIDRICDLIGGNIERSTQRSNALSVKLQVLITLRYLASGNFMQTVGDTFCVDKGTVSRVVKSVVSQLCSLKNRFITFPTTAEVVRREQNAFYNMHGFPCVIGCIDGTHVRILSPGSPAVNRKNFHSINVQVTCDSRGLITSINAAWPGAAHDAHVFRSSAIGTYLDRHHRSLENGVLLGDSGYPCRTFLLTPYLNATNAVQERYNDSHSKTRCCIERLFGVWKRRFHILHAEIRLKPEKCSNVIIACAVLHNLAKLWGEPEVLPEDELRYVETPAYIGHQDGRGIRDHIANNYFAR